MGEAPRSRVPELLFVLLALLPLEASLATKRQLLSLGGLTDEWLYLGGNLRVTGSLADGDRPIVLRAPGYPLFIAGILALAVDKPARVTQPYLFEGAEAVYAVQALLMAVSGLMLSLWLSDFVPRGAAFAAGLLLATNPHAVVLVGLLHYSTLHIFFLTAGGLALHRVLSAPAPSRGALLASGLLWGCATLVRSTTLILPPFVLALLFLKLRSLRRALLGAAVFSAGMCLVIAPATLRNYAVAHRFVPVNLQAGAALWGSTVKPLAVDPDSYRWYELMPEFMRIYTRLTGEKDYDYSTFTRHHLELEDEMRREAFANLRADPRPYLINALRTVRTLSMDTSSILVAMFCVSQPPQPRVDARFFNRSVARLFLTAPRARRYVWLGSALTVLAGIGLVLALYRGGVLPLVPAVLFLCLLTAHALTYMDVLYYYARLPFVAFYAFYALGTLPQAVPEGLRGVAEPVAHVAPLLLCLASLLLTMSLLR